MTTLLRLFRQWFPLWPDPLKWFEPLARFYRENADYHRMTSSGGKVDEPQTGVLSALIRPAGRYLEVGCGGGEVARDLARQAAVVACDYSSLALQRAANAKPDSLHLLQANAGKIPLGDATVDGAYSFEVLEHVWNPMEVVREMIRVVRPGGFVLISVPNQFSLDWHLPKRWQGRMLDLCLAGIRWTADRISGRVYVNREPDLNGPVYADCDMVSCVIPRNLVRFMDRSGCRVAFWDTGYMRAHKIGQQPGLDYQHRMTRPFWRNFGDHLLLLARKGKCSVFRSQCSVVRM